jgi:ADP-ribosylglycohydrolase
MSHIVISRQNRVAGGLLGLLVGDALGVPYEFHAPEDLPPASQIEMTPPAGFRRAHVGVPPGTWSDDGAQALVPLDSLLAQDGLDLEHFAHGLTRWLHQGFFAVNNSVFDVGAQTSTAISRLMQGVPAERSGPNEESRNGNGSLMRVLPLVLWHQGSDDELAYLAARQSLPTHGHPRSQVACAQYCLWARRVLEGKGSSWDSAADVLRAMGADFPDEEINLVLDEGNRERCGGSGYVLDCLWTARVAVEATGSYEDCVRRAISFGHDTETTAAVAGGIAGLMYGRDGIPSRWRAGLRGQEQVLPLLDLLA